MKIKKDNLTNSKNNVTKKENNEINVEKNNISDVFNLNFFFLALTPTFFIFIL